MAVNITVDQILEAPEIFTVSLSTQDSDVLLSNSTAEINISDNDCKFVRKLLYNYCRKYCRLIKVRFLKLFFAHNYIVVEISMPELVSVVEDQRSANVCATIDGAFQRNVDIGFTTTDDDGTALGTLINHCSGLTIVH